MPSHVYAIAGASRGLGLQFVIDLLARGDIVVAIARNPDRAEELQKLVKLQDEKNESEKKLFVVKGDIADTASMEAAANETAKLVPGGAIDVLINNAAYMHAATIHKNTIIDYSTPALISEMTQSFQTNILGPIITTNVFLPLLRNGSLKKVITLNTGLSDPQLTLKGGLGNTVTYSVTKSALEMVNVKYAVALKDEGFTFLDISPGVVNTAIAPPSEEELNDIMKTFARFKSVYPEWSGIPMTPAESVKLMLDIMDNSSVEDSGKFVSHKNNREWL
ncbi:hypothetical protein D9758_014945 [Tetrapyrgos nigripes]|uniref:NAD(P)-binding protein n=1 Tax=Tetrapyrgos nigripes TaxID=182062 RepID=A0A8H5CLD6_9AGAR|nr:hypothetical protein D9758_014945 [Tetrapyrgos nigripes]